MPLSHTCTDGATGNSDHLDQILSDLGTESRRLSERAPAEQDFERFEGELHELFAAAERALLAHELEQLDVDRPAVTIAGQRHHRVLRSTATYTSAVGPVTVLRTLYRAGCEPAVVPLELRAGIIEGHWTPRAAHQASYLVAHLTPREAADTLRELGNMSPSEEQSGPAPEAAEQPLGGAPRRVRGGVAGGAIRALCSDHGGGIAGWSDGADEGRGAAGEACRNAG